MLTTSEKALLDVVLQTAGDNENMIRDGVIKALRGINDEARRKHLWCVLPNAAKAKIRAARKKVAQRHLVTA